MLGYIGLYAFGARGVMAEETGSGIPWWAILLLLAIVTIVVIWALTRNAEYSETDAPHVDHSHSERSGTHTSDEPAYVEPAPTTLDDDLKIIEGIGPKIADVLKSAGIRTFAQLAETDPNVITKILEEADPRLARLGNPATWPEQARLAAAGDQSGLTALQESLKGGRRTG